MLKTRSGRVIHALITQSVVRSGAGLRTHSMVRDLAPERDWQQALAQSRERFERFFANAPVGIALLDRDGKFVEANATLGAFLGAEPASLIGKTLLGYLVESERADVARKARHGFARRRGAGADRAAPAGRQIRFAGSDARQRRRA